MSNTRPVKGAASVTLFMASMLCHSTPNTEPSKPMTNVQATSETLSTKQLAIIPLAAFGAVGDIPRFGAALNQGLGAGLTVNDIKEILVQLYAYAGFPRSLNALGELLKTVEERKKRGVQDAEGVPPGRAVRNGRKMDG